MAKILFKGMAALCMCAAFASCSKDLFDASYEDKKKEASYEEAFIKQFGPVSPTQNWDFTQTSSTTTRSGGEGTSSIAQLNFNNSGIGDFAWIWESGNPNAGELNNGDLAKILKASPKAAIKGLVDKAESKQWNPDQYGLVYFRVYASMGNKSTNPRALGYDNAYQRFGIHVPNDNGGQNYWIAQSANVSTNYWLDGNKSMARPRCIDVAQLPEGTSWFIISQAPGNENDAILASAHALTTFKEVVWTDSNNKSYTFWAFDCNNDTEDDLILWVKAEARPIPTTMKRYMAEDLGGDGDIDFNDIVFDIVENSDGQTCIVRALGGTLNIAILVNGTEYWRKSNDPNIAVGQMYNTGYKGAAIDYHGVLAEFPISGWDSNSNNVSIAVYGDGSTANAVTYIDFPITGSIPRMIAVDVRKYWQLEQVKIKNMSWFTTLDE